jgi:hypothetical protein
MYVKLVDLYVERAGGVVELCGRTCPGEELMEKSSSGDWKTKVMLLGGIAGALVGAGAAYLYVRSVEAEQGGTALTPRPVKPTAAVSVGLSVLSLLRQIANLGMEE